MPKTDFEYGFEYVRWPIVLTTILRVSRTDAFWLALASPNGISEKAKHPMVIRGYLYTCTVILAVTYQQHSLFAVACTTNVHFCGSFANVPRSWNCLHKVVCKTNTVSFHDFLSETASYAVGCYSVLRIEYHIAYTWMAFRQFERSPWSCLCMTG